MLSFFLYIVILSSAGESEIASLVITESDVEGEEAKKILEDIHLTFPEVCKLQHPKGINSL